VLASEFSIDSLGSCHITQSYELNLVSDIPQVSELNGEISEKSMDPKGTKSESPGAFMLQSAISILNYSLHSH
jgi:hypothetical protein